MENNAKPFAAAKVIDYVTSKGGQGFIVLPEWDQECG